MKHILLPAVVLSITLTALVIYLTPLRYTDLIQPSINDITSEEFYAEYVDGEKEHLLIDVRPTSMFDTVHAENSISIPLHLLYDERHNLPKKDTEIVLICSGGRASGIGYSYLEHYGFSNIKRIEGGIEAWVEAGLPTDTNE